jgi:hypothetical protein
MTASPAFEREWEESPAPARYDTGWTMDRFVEWTFGPRRLFDAVGLVRKIGKGIDALLERPDDASLRRSLVRWMMALRDQADAQQWRAEADVVASLASLARLDGNTVGMVRDLRAGLRAVEDAIQKRLDAVGPSPRRNRP